MNAPAPVSSPEAVWQALLDWNDPHARLATVLASYGSSPRPPGSMAAIRSDGAVVGSVSGGCIEADLMQRLDAGGPMLLHYGGTPEENRRWQLPCGGRLTLLWEPAPPRPLVVDLLAALRAREPIAREVDLGNGSARLVPPRDEDVWLTDAAVTITYRPALRLMLVGAVDIARHLAAMAGALGWEVWVCEPREEYRATWPENLARLTKAMPDDALRDLAPDAATAVIALTHDPRLDDMALMEALPSCAFYVGALGSRRNQARRRERLALLELAPEAINRLRGPVGLPIGSKRPAEIAVAILADLIATRNGVQLVPAAGAAQP